MGGGVPVRRRRSLDRALAAELLAPVEVPTFPGVAPNRTTVFAQRACEHCGGVHARNCPAVAEISYHPDGKVAHVKFFPPGTWPDDQVIWLDDCYEAVGSGER